MKKVLIFLFSTGILISCNKSDSIKNSGLIGKWKLIEVLADPGDGSGTFQSVSSDKTIEFLNDGTVTSNGSICNITVESGSSSTGKYSVSDSTINSSYCPNTALKISFHNTGPTLTISYPCDEPCIAKYIKL